MGYVGAVSAACLARDGHDVIGVDLDADKLRLIESGHAPIVEEGIQALMRDVVSAGRLTVISRCDRARCRHGCFVRVRRNAVEESMASRTKRRYCGSRNRSAWAARP